MQASVKQYESLQQVYSAEISAKSSFEATKYQADAQVKSALVSANAQTKSVNIAEKNLDMQYLDLNEMKAFNIIAKYSLADSDKLVAFADKAKSGDVDAIKDLKTLQTYLQKDGKYKGSIDGVLGDGVVAGIGAFISENAEGIKKYVEAKNLINNTGNLTPSSGGVKTQTTEVQH